MLVRVLFLVVLALAAASPAAAAPGRIMSINGCTDLLLLQLVPRWRIVSVTYRARDTLRGFAPGLADGIRTNDGRPEEVAALKPDLLVAGRFTTTRTKDFARHAGIRVVELDDANTFDDIRRITRQLGAAVGEPARAEALVARMDGMLGELARSRLPRAPVVAAWSGGGIVLGQGTLTDAIITAAGARNLAAGQGALGFGNFDVETLLRERPDALIQTDPRLARPTLQREQGRHRVVRRLYAGRTVGVPEAAYSCGLPQSAEAALALHRALAALGPIERLR